MPQLENGYTRIANEVLEALAKIRISGEARQMLDVIIRKTYGFNKKMDSIPTSQFVELTGLSPTSVHKARKKLLELNLITITKKGNSQVLNYSFQKNYKRWQPLPKKVTVTKKGNTPLPKKDIPVTKKGNNIHKRNFSKETITKERKEIYKEKVEKFKIRINDFIKIHPKYLPVKDVFIEHWTEPNEKKTRLRYEDQKFFDLGKRLGTFLKNHKGKYGDQKTISDKYPMPESIWHEYQNYLQKADSEIHPLIKEAFKLAGISSSYMRDCSVETAQRILRPKVERVYRRLIEKEEGK